MDALSWLDSHTSTASDWSMTALLKGKGKTKISVVLPALNEAETIGSIIATIRNELMQDQPLIDEIVVIDGASSDQTAEVATRAGARVFAHDLIITGLDALPGKGEAMWRSLFCTSGEIIVFLDADLKNFTATYVTGLLGPLLTDSGVDLVKGFYERPTSISDEQMDQGGTAGSTADSIFGAGGGRVTELVARPLLNLHWPELSGVIQPLAGEYAARRSLLEKLPFPTGYGIELALLVDTVSLRGLSALAQVDLGERVHRHQDLQALGRMATEIWQVALDRLDRDGRIVLIDEPQTTLTQFTATQAGHQAYRNDMSIVQRPPAISLAQYRDLQPIN